MRPYQLALLLPIVAACGSDSVDPGKVLDETAPTVAIVSPAPGAVDGIVTISVDASDNDEVAHVRFRVNGALLLEIDSIAPYEFTWNTGVYSAGLYEWRAIATDRAGNGATSAAVTYTYHFPSIRSTSLTR